MHGIKLVITKKFCFQIVLFLNMPEIDDPVSDFPKFEPAPDIELH